MRLQINLFSPVWLALFACSIAMARKPTILQSEFPYNVSARCINRDWFSIPMTDVWKIFCDQLYFIHYAYDVQIHAFVLMANHFHLIISTPQANISAAMKWFMQETSRHLAGTGGRINLTYGDRYFKCIMESHHYYLNAYKYLYHNPIKAGICTNILDYPFSSLQGLLGKDPMHFPVIEDTTLFSGVDSTIEWLNQKPLEQNWDAVRTALRKRIFRLPRINKRLHDLEIDTL